MSCHHGTPHSAHGAQSENATKNEYPTLNFEPGAKWIKSLTRNRLDTFTGGHFSQVNLTSVLFIHRLDSESHVQLQVWSAPGLSKPTFQEAMQQTFKPAKKGDSFGPSCMCTQCFLGYAELNLPSL